MVAKKDLDVFCQKISYQFKDKSLLKQALTHPSFCGVAGKNYERLEFLGDSVLGLVMAQKLIEKFPSENEGKLSKRKSYLVSGAVLAQIGQKIAISDYLLLAKGEENLGGRNNERNIENALEALIGAIYCDSKSLEVCQEFIEHNWQEFFADNNIAPKDPVSLLQEVTQGQFKQLPKYEFKQIAGNDHNPVFEAILTFSDKKYAAQGSSKKMAQRNAAAIAVDDCIAY
jgi:ribonuclease III